MKNERCRNCLPSRVGRCKNVVQTDTTSQSANHLDSSQVSTATQEDSITTLSSLQHSPQQVVGGGHSHFDATMHELTQNLPSFCHAHPLPDDDYRLVIKSAYDQVVHWKSFLFPWGM